MRKTLTLKSHAHNPLNESRRPIILTLCTQNLSWKIRADTDSEKEMTAGHMAAE